MIETELSDNAWHHVAVLINGENRTVYLDGQIAQPVARDTEDS